MNIYGKYFSMTSFPVATLTILFLMQCTKGYKNGGLEWPISSHSRFKTTTGPSPHRHIAIPESRSMGHNSDSIRSSSGFPTNHRKCQNRVFTKGIAMTLEEFCKSVNPKYYCCQSLTSIPVTPVPDNGTHNVSEWWNLVSQSYPKYNATTKLLFELQSTFPDIVKIYSVGKSVEQREMWVIHLRRNVTQKRKLLQPPMKIVANTHGDETVGRAVVLMLAVDILKKYSEGDARVFKLLEATDIHLMPSLNPDGFEVSKEGECSPNAYKIGRQNANGVDLNRDFPDKFLKFNEKRKLQPETSNMVYFIESNYFVLSANLHSGDVVVNYPFDSISDRVRLSPSYRGSDVPSLSPDNEVFIHLSKIYASNHKTMHNRNEKCSGSRHFNNGIINGADWFTISGGMQDFNYERSNCFEITVELSCCKSPAANTLLQEWDNNEESLYRFIEATHLGVRGIVTGSQGNPVVSAEVIVEGIDHNIFTTYRGEYWRLLVAGEHKIKAVAKGYKMSDVINVKVPPVQDLRKPVIINFILTEEDGHRK